MIPQTYVNTSDFFHVRLVFNTWIVFMNKVDLVDDEELLEWWLKWKSVSLLSRIR